MMHLVYSFRALRRIHYIAGIIELLRGQLLLLIISICIKLLIQFKIGPQRYIIIHQARLCIKIRWTDHSLLLLAWHYHLRFTWALKLISLLEYLSILWSMNIYRVMQHHRMFYVNQYVIVSSENEVALLTDIKGFNRQVTAVRLLLVSWIVALKTLKNRNHRVRVRRWF